MKWSKTLPRVSGWFWIRDQIGAEWIGDVEGRDATDDGWLWLDRAERIYLTPDARGEDGEPQDNCWLTWEWGGPIPMPNAERKG
jgi:hypothetical protein